MCFVKSKFDELGPYINLPKCLNKVFRFKISLEKFNCFCLPNKAAADKYIIEACGDIHKISNDHLTI